MDTLRLFQICRGVQISPIISFEIWTPFRPDWRRSRSPAFGTCAGCPPAPGRLGIADPRVSTAGAHGLAAQPRPIRGATIVSSCTERAGRHRMRRLGRETAQARPRQLRATSLCHWPSCYSRTCTWTHASAAPVAREAPLRARAQARGGRRVAGDRAGEAGDLCLSLVVMGPVESSHVGLLRTRPARRWPILGARGHAPAAPAASQGAHGCLNPGRRRAGGACARAASWGEAGSTPFSREAALPCGLPPSPPTSAGGGREGSVLPQVGGHAPPGALGSLRACPGIERALDGIGIGGAGLTRALVRVHDRPRACARDAHIRRGRHCCKYFM